MVVKQIITRDPETMSGIPVFMGTRVPVRTLFDYLSRGAPLAEFLDDFPTVSRELAVAVLQHAGRGLVEEDMYSNGTSQEVFQP